MDETRHRGRGRPQEVRRTEPGTGLPVELRLADISPTSRAILAGAFDVAIEQGVAQLTLRAVAQRAHVDLSTVKYHFESKAGLLEALLDSLYRDDIARFVEAAAQIEGVDPRLAAYFEMAEHEMTEGRDRLRTYFELRTHALREPPLAARFAAHDRWFLEAMLGLLYGPERAAREMRTPSNHALWVLLSAAIDGISLQHATDTERYPLHAVLDVLQRLALDLEDGIEGE